MAVIVPLTVFSDHPRCLICNVQLLNGFGEPVSVSKENWEFIVESYDWKTTDDRGGCVCWRCFNARTQSVIGSNTTSKENILVHRALHRDNTAQWTREKQKERKIREQEKEWLRSEKEEAAREDEEARKKEVALFGSRSFPDPNRYEPKHRGENDSHWLYSVIPEYEIGAVTGLSPCIGNHDFPILELLTNQLGWNRKGWKKGQKRKKAVE
jgi:hypothetical protein